MSVPPARVLGHRAEGGTGQRRRPVRGLTNKNSCGAEPPHNSGLNKPGGAAGHLDFQYEGGGAEGQRIAVHTGCHGQASGHRPVSTPSGRGAWACGGRRGTPASPGGACVGNSDPVRPCRQGCARLVESPLTRDVSPRCRSLLARITAAFFSWATAGTGRRVAHRMSGSAGPPLG